MVKVVHTANTGDIERQETRSNVILTWWDRFVHEITLLLVKPCLLMPETSGILVTNSGYRA